MSPGGCFVFGGLFATTGLAVTYTPTLGKFAALGCGIPRHLSKINRNYWVFGDFLG
jgi:hypothetical protein